MNHAVMDRPLNYPSIALAPADERAAFIRRTYAHLAGAILAFAAVEWIIFNLFPSQQLDRLMVQYMSSGFARIITLVAFIGGGWVARRWAYSGAEPAMQYVGLGVYIVLEAVIFVPLLWMLTRYASVDPQQVLTQAGVLTLCLFGGLTAVVFLTRTDFSFLAPILAIGSFLMLGLFVLGFIFGFGGMGLWLSFAMVALAAGFILYDTSNVLRRFRSDMHVAAALELFASVAVMFYYIIMILMSRNSRS